MENPTEALPLIKESLDGRRQTLGDDHINTLNSISLLSEVYADMRVRPKPRQNNRFKTPTAFRCALWYALVLSTWMYSDTGCCCFWAGRSTARRCRWRKRRWRATAPPSATSTPTRWSAVSAANGLRLLRTLTVDCCCCCEQSTSWPTSTCAWGSWRRRCRCSRRTCDHPGGSSVRRLTEPCLCPVLLVLLVVQLGVPQAGLTLKQAQADPPGCAQGVSTRTH